MYCYVTIYRVPVLMPFCSSPSSCWNDDHFLNKMKMRYVQTWFCLCFSLHSKPMWGCVLWLPGQRWLLLQSACDEVLTTTRALLPPQRASQGKYVAVGVFDCLWGNPQAGKPVRNTVDWVQLQAAILTWRACNYHNLTNLWPPMTCILSSAWL